MPYRVVELVVGDGEQLARRTPLPTVYQTQTEADHAIIAIVVAADDGGFDADKGMYWARSERGDRCNYVTEPTGKLLN
jgi:hypothetical protein